MNGQGDPPCLPDWKKYLFKSAFSGFREDPESFYNVETSKNRSPSKEDRDRFNFNTAM